MDRARVYLIAVGELSDDPILVGDNELLGLVERCLPLSGMSATQLFLGLGWWGCRVVGDLDMTTHRVDLGLDPVPEVVVHGRSDAWGRKDLPGGTPVTTRRPVGQILIRSVGGLEFRGFDSSGVLVVFPPDRVVLTGLFLGASALVYLRVKFQRVGEPL